RFNLIWFLHSDSPFSRERKFALSLSKALSGESLLSTIYRAFPVLKLHRLFPDLQLKSNAAFSSLVFRITSNTVLDMFRKYKSDLQNEQVETADVPPQRNRENRNLEEGRRLDGILYQELASHLSGKEWFALKSRFVDRLKVEDIAAELKTSVSSTRRMLRRAVDKAYWFGLGKNGR
ncbi:MAG: RNA polymerase sigma factor, partial [Bryobacteraceae bacterium]